MIHGLSLEMMGKLSRFPMQATIHSKLQITLILIHELSRYTINHRLPSVFMGFH